jgi:hypothetical protein
MVARDGIEPPTAGLSMAAIKNPALRAKTLARPMNSDLVIVVARDGIEPPTAGLSMAAIKNPALRAKTLARPMNSDLVIVVARDGIDLFYPTDSR